MSTTASISSLAPNTTSQPASTDRIPITVLDQDDFLQLLVTQLANQDPLNPKTDTEFISQMAQFSTLEQSRAMQKELGRLSNEQQFARAQTMVGQTVKLETEQGATVEGQVTGYQIQDGQPRILVNGAAYELGQVISSQPTPNSDFTAQFSQASSLVGRDVQVETDQGWIMGGTVTGVEFLNGQPRIQVNGQSFALDRVRYISAPYDPIPSELSRWRTDNQLLQANALVGRVVELQIDQDSTLTGVVTGAKIEAGTPKLIVDGKAYDVSRVISIAPVVPEITPEN